MTWRAGMKNNRCADRLAYVAVVNGGIVKDSTGILNVLKDNYIVLETTNDSESTTLIMMTTLHFKAGSARQRQYAERQRKKVNQHTTETVCL
jgi:hypothetical protein